MSIESEEDIKAASQPNNTTDNCEESENNIVNSSEDEVTLRTSINKNNSTEGEIINLIENVDKSLTSTPTPNKPVDSTSISSKSDSEEDPVPLNDSTAPVTSPLLGLDEAMDTVEAREDDEDDIALVTADDEAAAAAEEECTTPKDAENNKRPNRDTPATSSSSNNDSGEVTVVEEGEEEQESSPDPKVPSSPNEDSMTPKEVTPEDSPMDMAELKEEIISEAESLLPDDILCKLKAQVRTLKRTDLEALIIDKIIEAIAIHSNVGVLSQKLIQSNTQRDRLFHKISNLQRQVAELQKAVRSVSENVGRNQGTTFNKANQPIRFYRSVGVQVVLEGTLSSVRNLQQTQAGGDSPKSILKSGNNTATTITPVNNNCGTQMNGTIITARPSATAKPVSSPATASALVIGGNVNPGLKRVMNSPSLTVSEMSKQVEAQVQAQNKMRRIVSDNGMTTTVMSNGVILNGVTATKVSAPVNCSPQNQVRQPPALHQIRNPAAAAANKALNAMAPNNNSNNNKALDHGVVDLTDDDLPMMSTAKSTVLPGANPSLIVNGSTASNVVLQPQGVQQYRLISPGQPLQFIQNGKSYQLVTSAGPSTNRPVFMSTTNLQQPRQIRPTAGTAAPNQILLARGVQMSSAQNNTMTPISINNAGQLVMSRFPATGRPPLTAVAPTMVSKQQQMNLMASRPGVTMTAAQPVAKQTYANGTGIGSRLITPQQLRGGGGATLTRVVARSSIETALKKFILPPLPPPAITGNPRRCSKDIPPRPELTLMEQNEGIVLSWTLKLGSNHAEIQTYQIYACQEPLFNNQKAAAWKRVGDVKALPLPMACTLSQFTDENRYHFIVRGVDVYNRTGPFCEASAITLKKKS